MELLFAPEHRLEAISSHPSRSYLLQLVAAATVLIVAAAIIVSIVPDGLQRLFQVPTIPHLPLVVAPTTFVNSAWTPVRIRPSSAQWVLKSQPTMAGRLKASTLHAAAEAIVIREDKPAADFKVWAERAGIVTSKIALATFGELDGVVATDDIRSNDLLIGIPRSGMITTQEDAEANPIDTVADVFWKRAHYTTRLALKLLVERQQGAASYFAAYIAALPKDFSTPFFWDDATLEELQYPLMVKEVQKQREDWQYIYDGLQKTSPKATFTWEEFAWALSVVRSRSYRGEFPKLWGDKVIDHCLLPWIDMINSRSTTPTVISWNTILQRLELRAGEAFSKGEQVWVTYDKPNDDLLQLYGYIEPNNPGDSYCMEGVLKVIRDDIEAVTDAEIEQRMQVIRKLGLQPYVESLCVSRGAPLLRSVQALRILFTPEGQDAVKNKDQVIPEVEKLVYLTLYLLGQQAVESWPTTIQQDEDLLQTMALGPKRLAVEYRREKKGVLTAFLDALEEVL